MLVLSESADGIDLRKVENLEEFFEDEDINDIFNKFTISEQSSSIFLEGPVYTYKYYNVQFIINEKAMTLKPVTKVTEWELV